MPSSTPQLATQMAGALLAARPELDVSSPVFSAAMVVLAAPHCRFTIDRLALRCGLRRELVAGCVRRLVDNGAWGDALAEGGWQEPADPRFWNDVAVASGMMHRRRTESGQVEWAPAGAWCKPFDFVGDDAQSDGLAVAYRDRPEAITGESVAAPQPLPEAVPAAEPAPLTATVFEFIPTQMAAEPLRTPDPAPPPTRTAIPPPARTPSFASRAISFGETLFPNTIWLGEPAAASLLCATSGT